MNGYFKQSVLKMHYINLTEHYFYAILWVNTAKWHINVYLFFYSAICWKFYVFNHETYIYCFLRYLLKGFKPISKYVQFIYNVIRWANYGRRLAQNKMNVYTRKLKWSWTTSISKWVFLINVFQRHILILK